MLNQNFTVDSINKAWVQDITFIYTDEGWLYLSGVLDLFSRRIVGLSMGNRIDANLFTRSLNQALLQRNPMPGFLAFLTEVFNIQVQNIKKLLMQIRFY